MEMTFHPDGNLPGCMMPDGGECCVGHTALVMDWHKQRLELEQIQAKLTCMCGDYVADHRSPMSDGHSPVSMYDYALSRTEEENMQLKARVAQLESRLEQVFP